MEGNIKFGKSLYWLRVVEIYLQSIVNTKVLLPLNHFGPHVLCFLNIKLPCFQKSAKKDEEVIVLHSTYIEN